MLGKTPTKVPFIVNLWEKSITVHQEVEKWSTSMLLDVYYNATIQSDVIPHITCFCSVPWLPNGP